MDWLLNCHFTCWLTLASQWIIWLITPVIPSHRSFFGGVICFPHYGELSRTHDWVKCRVFFESNTQKDSTKSGPWEQYFKFGFYQQNYLTIWKLGSDIKGQMYTQPPRKIPSEIAINCDWIPLKIHGPWLSLEADNSSSDLSDAASWLVRGWGRLTYLW
jgi:hypothetical protein